MTKNGISATEVNKLLTGRQIYVRCKDARFLITRSSFQATCKSLNHKPFFNVEYDEKKIMIEEVNQLLHQGVDREMWNMKAKEIGKTKPFPNNS